MSFNIFNIFNNILFDIGMAIGLVILVYIYIQRHKN